ncbi:unnamed protein product, partial [Didymodactylos carnosus]
NDNTSIYDTTTCSEPIHFHKKVETKPTKLMVSFKTPVAPYASVDLIHHTSQQSFDNGTLRNNKLPEITQDSLMVIRNIGLNNHNECFYSELSSNDKLKISVILYEPQKKKESSSKSAHLRFYTLTTLKKLKHVNLVRCLGYVRTSPERYLLVTEHHLHNLYDHIKTLSNDESIYSELLMYVEQIVSALSYLELSNIIHHDLTLPNCLLYVDNHQSTIKISDYASLDDKYDIRYHTVGEQKLAIRYLPTEAVIKDDWSLQTNSYMFGTLLWEMFNFAQKIPWSNLNDEELFLLFEKWTLEGINTNEITLGFERPQLCTDRLFALIERCLSSTNSDRPSFREISLCLNETPLF